MANEKDWKEMRITPQDLAIIKSLFKGNDDAIKLLRKIFLPEITAKAPLGQNIDLWMTLKIDDMTPEQALINLKARNTVITHIEQQLLTLKVLANTEELTPEEALAKLKKDSSK